MSTGKNLKCDDCTCYRFALTWLSQWCVERGLKEDIPTELRLAIMLALEAGRSEAKEEIDNRHTTNAVCHSGDA